MKIKNLVIDREHTYSDEMKPLQGKVQMEGLNGKMEVSLSNMTIVAVLELIRADVVKTAEYNSQQANGAVEDALGEQKLIEHE